MSYEWITPKTDWTTTTRFEYTDYNRIRNNLLYINDMLNELYPDKAQTLDLGDAKTGYANEYAVSEFNAFEEALESFTRIGKDVNVGDRNYYRGNNSFIWADALNRLEQCCLKWKESAVVHVESVTISGADNPIEVWTKTTYSAETIQLTATILPLNASNKNVTWSSSDTSVATVSQTGLVKRVGRGSATITVKTEEGNKTDTRTINVHYGITTMPKGYDISEDSSTNYYDKHGQINLDYAPSYAEGFVLSFSSSDNSIVEVDNTGYYIFKKTGQAIITLDIVEPHFANEHITITYMFNVINGSFFVLFDTLNYYDFVYLGTNLDNDSEGNELSTLIARYATSALTGSYGSTSESSARYRENVDVFARNCFSGELYGILQEAKKATISGDYSSKYFLIAPNEIGISIPSNVRSLGNVSYSYINTIKRTVGDILPFDEDLDIGSKSNTEQATRTGGNDGAYCRMNLKERTLEFKGWANIALLRPLFFISPYTYVTPIGNNMYAIDWEATSSSKRLLSSLSAGAIIRDTLGHINQKTNPTAITVSSSTITSRSDYVTTSFVIEPYGACLRNKITVESSDTSIMTVKPYPSIQSNRYNLWCDRVNYGTANIIIKCANLTATIKVDFK